MGRGDNSFLLFFWGFGRLGLSELTKGITRLDGITKFVEGCLGTLKFVSRSLRFPLLFGFSLCLFGPFAIALGHGEL